MQIPTTGQIPQSSVDLTGLHDVYAHRDSGARGVTLFTSDSWIEAINFQRDNEAAHGPLYLRPNLRLSGREQVRKLTEQARQAVLS